MPWPAEEKAFYLASADGLFLCRNHPFFRSSVPARRWPAGLAPHEASLRLNYPKLAQREFERVIGFFSVIAVRHCAEAAVLLAWNSARRAVEIIVPDQTSYVTHGWNGAAYPIELSYETPVLPPHLTLIGDIHCHVDLGAYASPTDRADEEHRPGLHIVVGCIHREPPEFHLEATVDGMRFRVKELAHVVEGYHRRRPDEVPDNWLERVTVLPWSQKPGLAWPPNPLPVSSTLAPTATVGDPARDGVSESPVGTANVLSPPAARRSNTRPGTAHGA
jgi:hypothetical protein